MSKGVQFRLKTRALCLLAWTFASSRHSLPKACTRRFTSPFLSGISVVIIRFGALIRRSLSHLMAFCAAAADENAIDRREAIVEHTDIAVLITHRRLRHVYCLSPT